MSTPTARGAGIRGELSRSGAGLLTLAGGGAALHQLLFGWHWFALLMLAGGVVAALGVAGRAIRLPVGAVLAAQLLAVAVLTTTLFARAAAVAGLLPGPAAVRTLVDTVQTGTDAINHYSPPAPAVTGIVLLIVVGGGLGGILIDLLVSEGWPALTGVVVLAFDAVTALCLPAGLNTTSFLLGGAGWLAVLLAAGPAGGHRRDVAALAEPAPTVGVTSAGSAGGVGPGGWTGAVGRRTALASLGLAAIGPALLPGLSSSRLTRLFAGGAGGGGTGGGGGQLLTVRDPLVELRRNLVQPQNVVVLRYGDDTTSGQYLRLATLDIFDGESWTADPRLARRRTDTGITAAEGLGAGVPRTAATTSYAVADGLSSSYLPVPYPAVELQADGGWWFDQPGLDIMSYSWRATGGFTYIVQSLALEFVPARLRKATAAPVEIAERDLALPTLPAVVGATARRVTAGAANDFDRAVALQTWFRDQFTYDTSIVDASSTGALVRFLNSQRGYCEQFSATMAVMARQLGIPARVVVGFLPGTQPDSAGWVVTAHEAHAWPELYFTGAGWVRFEPTPAVQSGGEPDWTVDTSTALGEVPTLGGREGLTRPLQTVAPSAKPSAAAVGGRGPAGGSRSLDAVTVLGAAAVAAAVAAALPAATARVLRERRWRTAGGRRPARHSPGDGPTGAAAGRPRDAAVSDHAPQPAATGRDGDGVDGPGVSSAGAGAGTGATRPGGLIGAGGTAGTPRPDAGPVGGSSQRTATASAGSQQARATAAAVQADLADMAWDHTGGWSAHTTPRQLGRQLARELVGRRTAADAAARLVALVEQVRYAPAETELPAIDLAAVRADSELVRRALAARSPRWRRLFTATVPAALRRRLGPPRPTSTGESAADGSATATAVTAEVLAHRGVRT